MSPISRPKGHHSITPCVVVANPDGVLSFCEKAFAGKVVDRYDDPAGKLLHAELRIGDSVVMLGVPSPNDNAMPASLTVYVDDADAVGTTYQRALDAGASSLSEPRTQPWGYRSACVSDAAGNRWTICAIVEELSHDEIVQRMQQMPHG